MINRARLQQVIAYLPNSNACFAVYPVALAGSFIQLSFRPDVVEANGEPDGLTDAKYRTKPVLAYIDNLAGLYDMNSLLGSFRLQNGLELHPDHVRRFLRHFLVSFYVNVVPIFDFATHAILMLAPAPQAVLQGRNFMSLLDWCESPRTNTHAEGALSTTLYQTILRANWFREVTAVRNGLVHEREPFSFREVNHRWFFRAQRGENFFPSVRTIPPLFFDSDFADVWSVTTSYLVETICFLNELVDAFCDYLGVAHLNVENEDLRLGLVEFRNDVNRLLQDLPV